MSYAEVGDTERYCCGCPDYMEPMPLVGVYRQIWDDYKPWVLWRCENCGGLQGEPDPTGELQEARDKHRNEEGEKLRQMILKVRDPLGRGL